MHFRFEADSDHIERVLNAPLVVYDIALGDDLEDLPVHRYDHGARGFEDPGYVVGADFPNIFPVFAGYRDDAPGIYAVDVVSPDAGPTGTHFLSAHPFGSFDSSGY
jgi:hypothetical protein